jgi:transposase-like protein
MQALGAVKAQRRYQGRLRRRIGEHAKKRLRTGASIAAISKSLDISEPTLSRILQESAGRGGDAPVDRGPGSVMPDDSEPIGAEVPRWLRTGRCRAEQDVAREGGPYPGGEQVRRLALEGDFAPALGEGWRRQSALVPVAIVPPGLDEQRRSSLTFRGPCGTVVEGLSLDEVALLFARLSSCSG